MCVSFCLQRLESEKEELESDLSFKAEQAQQYDRLLEAVRENNRQLQVRAICHHCTCDTLYKGSKSEQYFCNEEDTNTSVFISTRNHN